MGNIFGCCDGCENDLLLILIGSYLDIQINGGCFDGIVGVLVGFEFVCSLNDVGYVIWWFVVVVDWINEEGVWFLLLMVVLGVFIGCYELDWVYDLIGDDGVCFGDELVWIGYVGDWFCKVGEIDVYFELYIE